MALDVVVGGQAVGEFPGEKPVQPLPLLIRQAPCDASKQRGLRAGVNLLGNVVQGGERWQLDLVEDQRIDGGVDDVHLLVHRFRGFACGANRDLVGIGANIGLDAKKFAHRRVMPVQRGGQLAVIAKRGIRRQTSAGAHVVDHDDGNAVQVGEVMQLLEDLQQHQQAKSWTLSTG